MKGFNFAALATTAAAAVLLLAGCGPQGSNSAGSSQDTGKTKQLVVWQDKNKAKGNTAAFKAFEKANNIKIKVVEKTYVDQLEDLRLDGPAGTGPDVLAVPGDQIGTGVTEGLLKPLSVSSSLKSSFTPSAINTLTLKGKTYGLPYAVESTILFYNKDLVKPADLPKTMDEWYALSKKMTKNGNYGLLVSWDQLYYAISVIQPYGGYVFGQDSKGNYKPTDIGLANAGAIKAVDYMGKFYKEGLFPKGIIGDKGTDTLDSLFTEGKAAAVISGPWNFEPYTKAKVNYGVVQLPMLANGKHMSSFIGVKSYSVSAYSKNAAMAEKLVKFLANEKNSKTRYEITQEIPAVKAVVDSTAVTKNEKATAVAEQSKYAKPTPNITEMNQVWDPTNSALQVVANGKQNAQQAMTQAVSTIKSAIKAAKK